jgi:hypothetical protein
MTVSITELPNTLKANKLISGTPLSGSKVEPTIIDGNVGIISEMTINTFASAPPKAPNWKSMYTKAKMNRKESMFLIRYGNP